MSSKYLIRPRADSDLESQALYLATHGSIELGHRFLMAAHETFTLLSKNPEIGWRTRIGNPELRSLRIFSVSGFDKVLVVYRPAPEGVEIIRVLHGSRNLAILLAREAIE